MFTNITSALPTIFEVLQVQMVNDILIISHPTQIVLELTLRESIYLVHKKLIAAVSTKIVLSCANKHFRP